MKFFIYILLAVYIFLSAGLTIVTHYCYGKMSSITLEAINSAENNNLCCNIKSHCGNCETKLVPIKIKESQKVESSKKLNTLHADIIDYERTSDAHKTFPGITSLLSSYTPEPDPPIYLSCRRLLI